MRQEIFVNQLYEYIVFEADAFITIKRYGTSNG